MEPNFCLDWWIIGRKRNWEGINYGFYCCIALCVCVYVYVVCVSETERVKSSSIFSQDLHRSSFCLPGTSRGSYPLAHSMNPHLHPRLYHGCYGDIMTMETFGAPCDINNLMNCGKYKQSRVLSPIPTLIYRVFLSFEKGPTLQ